LQELAEADRSNQPHSNKPLNNHRHSQLLMEVVEVEVEVEEVAEEVMVVVAHQDPHLLLEQPLSQLQQAGSNASVKKYLSYSYLFPSYPQNKRNKM